MRHDEFPIIDKYVEQERNKTIDRVLEIIDEIHENILRRDCIVAPQAQSVFIALRRRLGEMKGGEQDAS